MATFDEVLAAIDSATTRSPRVVVGVSGFGGAGKSTLARRLVEEVPGSVRIRGDDFLVPALTRERSADWAAFDRGRLRAEVLEPIRAGRPTTFRRLDWATGTLGSAEPLPAGSFARLSCFRMRDFMLELFDPPAVHPDARWQDLGGRNCQRRLRNAVVAAPSDQLLRSWTSGSSAQRSLS